MYTHFVNKHLQFCITMSIVYKLQYFLSIRSTVYSPKNFLR